MGLNSLIQVRLNIELDGMIKILNDVHLRLFSYPNCSGISSSNHEIFKNDFIAATNWPIPPNK